MSFRDNLQYLRAERNMTQEQLAMLLGVSRQSVTKWEAEKSVPDMSRLIKMCQLFDCTLDDLVTGDLTGRTPQPAAAAAAVPAGPPTDVCGYDDMQRRMARRVPAGVAAILAGCAVGMLLEGRSAFLGEADALMLAAILAGVVAGLAFLVPAGMEFSAFQRAHPYVEDFYTEDDRAQARSAFARALVAGIAAIFVGVVCVIVLGERPATEREGLCLLLLLIALGAWLIVRYGMLLGRTNVAEYNKGVAEDLEVEDIMAARLDDARREALLEARRANGRIGAVCGVIMIAATIVGLGERPATEREGLCLLLLLIALGAWLIVRYGMLLGRTNVAEYNKGVAEDLEVEDIMAARLDDARREALLEARRANGRIGAVCGVIMIAATIVGLGLLFAPVFSAPDPSAFDPVGTSAMWFWVAWPVGGLLCGVATLLMRAFGARD